MSATTTTTTVRSATTGDVASVARVLSRAFQDDPLFRWLFPEGQSRIAKIRRFHAIVAGFGYVPHGHTRVVELEESPGSAEPTAPAGAAGAAGTSWTASVNPVVRAAALWTPLGTNPEGPLVSPRLWPHWGPLLGRGRISPFMRIFAEWKLAAPQEPHLYLATLGVDPTATGTGLGGDLLLEGLAQADADGVPVFTQTMNAEAVGFYEHYGFEPVRETDHLEGGTTYFLMRE